MLSTCVSMLYRYHFAFALSFTSSASVSFTGYALQSVQIDYNNITKALSVSVDNVDVTDNVTALNTSESLSFSHFDLSNDNVTLISVVFSSGVVVNISVTAPFVLAMSMSGNVHLDKLWMSYGFIRGVGEREGIFTFCCARLFSEFFFHAHLPCIYVCFQ